MSQFSKINTVYKRYFGINPPIRICVEASLSDEIGMQLDCIAYRGEEKRETMHVQSISHWAPANIGPYSQATRLSDYIYVAGQIALCPATMKMVEGGILPECRLSLRHVRRVLQGIHSTSSIQNITMAICYVTHEKLSCGGQE